MVEERCITILVKVSSELRGKLYLAGPVAETYLDDLKGNYGHTYNSKWFYKGNLSREEVDKLYSISSVGICIFKFTRNNVDALPTKIFEYMEAGLPIVVSDFPLWREIVEDAGCGFCVDEENSKEIAEKINYLFSNPQEAAMMGTMGRKAVLEKYNWGIEEKKLLQAYSEL